MVKDNQKTLHNKLQAFFASPCLFEAEFDKVQTREIGHGRIETRRLWAAEAPAGYLNFPGIAQVFRLERLRQFKKSGKEENEVVYGVTSLPKLQASASDLLSLVRGHWLIENQSHHVRDVTFDEDRSQVRCGGLAQVLAAIRNLCIGLMRVLGGQNNIAAGCRYYAAQPWAALSLLGIKEKTE